MDDDLAGVIRQALGAGGEEALDPGRQVYGGGLHSSTFRLNVCDLCGIGAAFRGCFGGVYGVSRVYLVS